MYSPRPLEEKTKLEMPIWLSGLTAETFMRHLSSGREKAEIWPVEERKRTQ